MGQHELEIDIDKKYKLPENMVEKFIDDKFLIISVNTGNWIVLKNKNQKYVFDSLKNKTIKEAIEDIESNNIDINELIEVLIQLEAKRFESNNVSYPQKNGICIYLTNECNLRCKHCYMYSGVKNEQELSTEELFEILKLFKNNNGEVATFTGGEVSLRNDFAQILKFSKSIGLINTVLTNGVEWSNELIDNVSESIDEVQISIDGYNEESNSRIRGKGAFHKALHTVDRFYNKGIKLSVAITPLYDNLELEKDKYIEFAKTLMDKYNTNKFNVNFNYELLDGRNIKTTNIDNKRYSNIMREIVESCYPKSEEEDFVINHMDNMILDNCGYGGLTIASNGDIYMCNRIYELNKYGNVRTMPFNKILEQSKIAMKESNINNLEPCCNCDIKYICGGGCRISNFKSLIDIKDFQNNISRKHKRVKICDFNHKEQIYKMMINTNEKLFY